MPLLWLQSAGPRDGGGISERLPPAPSDRGSPRTPLDGPYDHYGGYPGGPPLGAPIYPMRRCSDSPGHPLMRMAYCGRSGERAGVPSGHRGHPLRLLQRRMPQSPLEQLHVHQEQQYHADVRSRHPSAWLGRRRSSSSSRSRSNGSYVASRGASSVLSLRHGSFIERDRCVEVFQTYVRVLRWYWEVFAARRAARATAAAALTQFVSVLAAFASHLLLPLLLPQEPEPKR